MKCPCEYFTYDAASLLSSMQSCGLSSMGCHHILIFQSTPEIHLGEKDQAHCFWALSCNPGSSCHFFKQPQFSSMQLSRKWQMLPGSCHKAQQWSGLLCFPNRSFTVFPFFLQQNLHKAFQMSLTCPSLNEGTELVDHESVTVSFIKWFKSFFWSLIGNERFLSHYMH